MVSKSDLSAFALHAADLGSIPGIPYVPQPPPGVITDCRSLSIAGWGPKTTVKTNTKPKQKESQIYQ